MQLRAETDSKFILRFLIIGLVLFGFGLYCLYDGFIKYPHDLERANGFFSRGITATGEIGWTPVPAEKWEEIASEHGWKRYKPKTPDVIEANILWQYGMAAMSFLVCFPILIHYFRSKNAWIQADHEGLSNNRGQKVSYPEIERIDKTRWEKKGIAKIEYSSDGQPQKFIIDDLKFKRDPTDEILNLVESKIDPSLVHGAPLEVDLAPSTSEKPDPKDPQAADAGPED